MLNGRNLRWNVDNNLRSAFKSTGARASLSHEQTKKIKDFLTAIESGDLTTVKKMYKEPTDFERMMSVKDSDIRISGELKRYLSGDPIITASKFGQIEIAKYILNNNWYLLISKLNLVVFHLMVCEMIIIIFN